MMVEDFSELSAMQIDALREIGNIGAGNAATALAQLLNRRINMAVPRISIVPFPKVPEAVGGAERLMVGVYLRVQGSAPGNILFLLPITNAYLLVDMLLGLPRGTTTALDDMGQSVLQEVGNILAGAYLNALSMFTSLNMVPSVPALAVDMAGAILSAVLFQLGEVGDHALLVETQFTENEIQVIGHFFLLPEPEALDTIMSGLGVNIQ
ncbi:MAG: chemotaxis protein CheC [Firmicutes bacterium]|nr:chemotaxis protein CheC [Bacillota bacterium]